MSFLDLVTHRIHYRVDGEAGRPWLLMSNSLGTDLHMWDEQIPALSSHFHVLRYDQRGHGASSAPPSPYSLAELAGDALALLDALRIERAHFCGLSIGGLIGQWLAINAGARVSKLVVCSTAPRIGTPEGWLARIEQVRASGLQPLAEATAQRWFTPAFNMAESETVEVMLKNFIAVSVDAYCGCCCALAYSDLRSELVDVRMPVLTISGEDDPVCPPVDLQAIAASVADGRHVSLPGRHIVNLELPQRFNEVLRDFLLA
jgi:3-oxoadipate enol-lactonase